MHQQTAGELLPTHTLEDRSEPPARASVLRWCCAFFVVAALQLLVERTYVKAYDEGLILYGASVVSHGGVPYRDFWSLYGPGSFYALAALDLGFGESVLTGRFFDVAARAAIVLLVQLLVRRQAGKTAGLACGLLAFGVLAVEREYLFPALPATASALLTLVLLDRLLRADIARPGAWFVPGTATGLTLLFRHDFGVSVMLGCGWALFEARSILDGPSPRPARAIAAYLAGVALVGGPLYAYLAFQVPIASLFEQLVELPLKVYAANRALPFPRPAAALRAAYATHAVGPLVMLLVYVPILAVVAGAVASFASRRPAGAHPDRTRCPVALYRATLVILACLCIKGSIRVEIVHMLPAILLSIVLGGLSLASRPRAAEPLYGRALAALVVAVVIGLACAVFAAAVPARKFDRDAVTYGLRTFLHCKVDVARLGCFSVDEDRLAVLQFLAAHARPGDTLYVGPGRHDKVLVNNVELLFLSGLPAATRWADVHPGVQTTELVQRQMIDEFTRNPPAFVVANSAWDDASEPNASRLSSGVTVLDDYLRLHYRPELRHGTLTVSVPKS